MTHLGDPIADALYRRLFYGFTEGVQEAHESAMSGRCERSIDEILYTRLRESHQNILDAYVEILWRLSR